MKRRDLVLVLILLLAGAVHAQTKLKTKNVVVITTDGLRWQEVFRGGKEAYMNLEDGGVREADALKADFARPTPQEARMALMPFLWGTVAKQGLIYGNKDSNSLARVTNTFRFSYPGYNEILTGRFDPQINSNDFGPNPNETVFEWLQKMPEYRGRVSAFGAWYVFGNIFRGETSGLFVRSQWQTPVPEGVDMTAREKRLRMLYENTTRIWSKQVYDSFLYGAVADHVDRAKPRVLYVGFGETDEWAHSGRYDLYLRAAHNVDALIGRLWAKMQSIKQYRDSTTFIITTDHGRGTGPKAWKNHGEKVDGSEFIWIAVIGPDTPALGERTSGEVTQSQVAATVAALLGKDYNAAEPEAGKPLAEALPKGH